MFAIDIKKIQPPDQVAFFMLQNVIYLMQIFMSLILYVSWVFIRFEK